MEDEVVNENPDEGPPISGTYVDLDSLSDPESERKTIPSDPMYLSLLLLAFLVLAKIPVVKQIVVI